MAAAQRRHDIEEQYERACDLRKKGWSYEAIAKELILFKEEARAIAEMVDRNKAKK